MLQSSNDERVSTSKSGSLTLSVSLSDSPEDVFAMLSVIVESLCPYVCLYINCKLINVHLVEELKLVSKREISLQDYEYVIIENLCKRPFAPKIKRCFFSLHFPM